MRTVEGVLVWPWVIMSGKVAEEEEAKRLKKEQEQHGYYCASSPNDIAATM